jgi:hypothetical protein
MVVAGKIVGAQMGRKNQGDDAVRLPSFSIADLMVIVAIVALDSLAIREAITEAQGTPTLVFLVLGGLPMHSVLVIGLLLMLRRRKLGREPVPFLIAFEVVGSICLVIYVVLCFQTARPIDSHVRETLGPLLRSTGFQPFSPPDWVIRVGLAMSYLTAPQLALALVGGWFSRRWWKLPQPALVPTHE